MIQPTVILYGYFRVCVYAKEASFAFAGWKSEVLFDKTR